MGAVKLKGATSGSTTITAPATGGDEVIELSTALDAKLDSTAYQPGLTLITSETFSAVSSVSLNGCFTSTYPHYRLVIGMVTHSAAGDAGVLIRLRASGADDTTSNYFWSRVFVSTAGSVGGSGAGSTTSWSVGATSNNRGNSAAVEIYNPQASARTGFSSGPSNDGGTSAFTYINSGLFTNTTQFDGFTLSTSNGNLTGTVRVYGYKD